MERTSTRRRVRMLGLLSAVLCLCTLSAQAQVSVQVYRDFNANATADGSEPDVGSLTVTAYQADGTSAVATYNASNGLYEFTAGQVPNGTAVRIEVTGLPAYLQPGAAGNTTVAFAAGGDGTVQIGVNNPDQYCQGDPTVALPCWENGEGDTNTEPAFISFAYSSSGVPSDLFERYGPQAVGPNPVKDAGFNEIGTTWGVAWQRTQERTFASAVLRRHSGIGPEGLGGVYVFDYTGGTPGGSLDDQFTLQGVAPANGGAAIDLGTVDRTGGNALPEDRFAPSYDLDAFGKVGKVGYGDIDMSDAETLWLVNLNQEALIEVDVSDASAAALPGTVNQYLLSGLSGLPTCTSTAIADPPDGFYINMVANIRESYIDAEGRLWGRDQYSDEAVQWSADRDLPFKNTNSGTGLGDTVDNRIYSYGMRDDDFDIRVPRPSATYDIVLHFATRAANENVLVDISAEGVLLVDDYEYWTAAGDDSTATTVVLNNVAVTDGELNLNIDGFDVTSGNPKLLILRGIEILYDSGYVPAPVGAAPAPRPWALKFHDGRGYLGLTCSGEASQNIDDVVGYIVSFDPNNIAAGFTTEASVDMDYSREHNNNTVPGTAEPLLDSEWWPWIDSWAETGVPDHRSLGWAMNRPQPIVADIEFAEDGALVVGLMDRWAAQVGYFNYPPIPGWLPPPTAPRPGFTMAAAGDAIHFCNSNGSFVLEGTGGCSENDPPLAMVNQLGDDGPSGTGEFYYGDYYYRYDSALETQADANGHNETLLGALAILPGSGEVLAVTVDPISQDDSPSLPADSTALGTTQGIRWMSTTTGAQTDGYLIVARPEQTNDITVTFGKAMGLGDAELLCEVSPLEIGNRVWCDNGSGTGSADNNGVQDPGEPGINSVSVTLVCDTDDSGTVGDGSDASATVLTAGDGDYLFTDAIWDAQVNPGTAGDMLPRETDCQVRVDLTDSDLVGTCSALITDGTDATNDIHDSDGDDGTLAAGFSTVAFTTGTDGANNHSYDFGFMATDWGDAPDSYGTDNSDDAGDPGIGPNHNITSDLYLGGILPDGDDGTVAAANDEPARGDDTDADGDDEDGKTPIVITTGATAPFALQVTATNTNATDAATLACWIDFNDDGTFDNATERAQIAVPANSGTAAYSLSFTTVNLGSAATGDVSYYRCRIAFDALEVANAFGGASSGEVEDCEFTFGVVDYGDAPDSYGTDNSDDAGDPGVGPSHVLTTDLYLGACVDDETNGVPATTGDAASGDDTAAAATTTLGTCAEANKDEDGIPVKPSINLGDTSVELTVDVFNNAGSDAYVACWIDFDLNGTFDASERAASGAISSSASSQQVMLTFSPSPAPASAGQSYIRCRLAQNQAELALPIGPAGSGEVEDCEVALGYDWGDAPDSYDTSLSEGGPRHVVDSSTLRMGSVVDADGDGQQNPTADGDDNDTGTNDEDGVTQKPTLEVGDTGIVMLETSVFNDTGSDAFLNCWIDLDLSGTFDNDELQTSADVDPIPSTGASQTVTLSYDLSANTPTTTGQSYIRCRLASVAAEIATPGGLANSGEVEDCTVTISTPLPVELGDFIAQSYDTRGVVLEWTTLSEDDNAGFAVEYAWNGADFVEAGFVDGHGTTTVRQDYRFVFAALSPGLYSFRLKQIDFDGAFSYSPVIEQRVDLPGDFLLEPAYPNPFNPSTNIRFTVRERGDVQVVLYDLTGRLLRTLHTGLVQAGETQTLRVDAAGLPSGTYVVRLEGSSFVGIQKITLIK